jgi:hypothetical protein
MEGIHLSSENLCVGSSVPFSFQQLTSAQSRNQPLNPVFQPFIALMMRIFFPSNNITSDQYPGKRVRTRFNPKGEPQAVGFCGLESQARWGKFSRRFPETRS